jgi:ferrous iron transport protein A
LTTPGPLGSGHPLPVQPSKKDIMLSLDQLQRGQRARVEAVAGHDAVVQRLLEMGLLEGEEIEVLGFAPLGDPMEIRLRDFRLSLRRQEAAGVTVIVLPH